jgi:hypothetical protein
MSRPSFQVFDDTGSRMVKWRKAALGRETHRWDRGSHFEMFVVKVTVVDEIALVLEYTSTGLCSESRGKQKDVAKSCVGLAL